MRNYFLSFMSLIVAILSLSMCTSVGEETAESGDKEQMLAHVSPFFGSDYDEISSDSDVYWAVPSNVLKYSESKFSKVPYREDFGVCKTWSLHREKSRTVLRCSFVMPSDCIANVWLGGDETYIVDQKTGVHYKARGCNDKNMWKTTSCVKAKKGDVVEFEIYFPPLDKNVDAVRIYGVPGWNLRGSLVRLLCCDRKYDKGMPDIKLPRLIEDKDNYNKDDMSTYDVYADAHLIKPVDDFTTAIWLTEEATYMAMAFEQNWAREYFNFEENTFLIDVTTSEKYKIRKIHGLPFTEVFFIEGVPGDHIAFLMEFEPLPLNTTVVNFYSAGSEPFRAWNANWDPLILNNLYISDLIDNQTLFKKYDRNVVE